MRFNSKGQIMIYVLIALFIFILLVFLITSNIDDKKNNVEIGKKENQPLNEELKLIKNRVDYCLADEFKKALIIAGLRGGNIYDDGEYTFPGVIPSNTYKPKFISNSNLDWNYLQSKVIVYSNKIPTPYEINNNSLSYNNKQVFTHTTKDDFKRFIAVGFGKCLNFDDVEDRYDFYYKDFYGDVINIDYVNKQIDITNLDAKIGDKILVDIGNGNITGIVAGQSTNQVFKVNISNVDNLRQYNLITIENLDVINLNNSIKINVDFNDEDIILKATYPVTLTNKNASTTFTDTTLKQNIRFKALLEFAKEMINTKYAVNKSIDYTNNQSVYKALNNSLYFKSTQFRNIKVFKTEIVNEDEHKQTVYSLVDNDFKINGNPYVFNFGYENHAPFVNFNDITTSFNVDEESKSISIVTSVGDTLKYNLRDSTIEKQEYDKKIFYFKEDTYSSLDADFKIDKYGNLTFTAKREQLYTYPIYVTDGETIRKHTITFIAGFPNNNNNSAALNCLKFRNYPDIKGLFPINFEFKNKIYSYDKNGYNNLFALSTYYPSGTIISPNLGDESEIRFSKSCLFDPTKYYINVKKTDLSGTVTLSSGNIREESSYYAMNVPIANYKQDFEIEIVSGATGAVMTEPFKISIHPTRCLGPEPNPTGFNVSCCDTSFISQKVNQAIATKDVASLSSLISDNVLKKNVVIFSEKVYACVDLGQYSVISNMFNASNDDVWNNIDTDITSFFETNLVIKCGGKYPTAMKNINSISIGGGKSFGTLKGIQLSDTLVDYNVVNSPVSLNLVQKANKCEFCYMNSTAVSVVSNYKGKNFVFELGRVSDNPAKVSYIPNEVEFNNLFVLADNSWYASNNPNPLSAGNWAKIAGVFGQGGSPEAVSVSKGYCQQDSNVISGRKNSPTYKYEVDSASGCVDYFFSPSNPSIIQMQANTGWVCGTDMICQAGLCKSIAPPPSP